LGRHVECCLVLRILSQPFVMSGAIDASDLGGTDHGAEVAKSPQESVF
jgi:hypothetical protein